MSSPTTANTSQHAAKPYLVAVLAAVFVFNAADRYALAVLIQPIKSEFHLTDGEAGLLIGLAFAIAYCAFAIPLGRLVDRAHRVRVIAACLAVWSLFTAAFGVVWNYWQFLLARIGVAAGEAGAYSATQSLIGDYFPAQRRSMAMSCMQFGSLLGMMGGLSLAGWLSDVYGWRVAFYVFGLSGLPLALLIFATMREPQRGAADDLRSEVKAVGNLGSALQELWSRRAYRWTLVGMGLASIALYGSVSWLPSFLIRKLALTTAQSGFMSGLLIPGPMMLGTLVCGLCSDFLYRRDPRWGLWIPALCFVFAVPCILMLIYAPGVTISFVAMALFAFICGFHNIPLLAMTMTLSGATLRGTSASLVAFLVILMGNGLGPALIGYGSDVILGLSSVRQPLGASIALTIVPLLLAVLPLLLATRHLQIDLSRARAFDIAG